MKPILNPNEGLLGIDNKEKFKKDIVLKSVIRKG